MILGHLLVFALVTTEWVGAQISMTLYPSNGLITFQETLPAPSVIGNISASSSSVGQVSYAFVGLLPAHYLAFQPAVAASGSTVNVILQNTISAMDLPTFTAAFIITDGNGATTYGSLTILVKIVPRTPPIWSGLPYVTSLAENASVGVAVYQISAFDPELNSGVTYFINDTTGTFKSVNGTIYLNFSLNFLARSVYYVAVYAQSVVLGVTLTSSTWLTVNVLDVPNRLPIFQQTSYYTTVSESSSALPSTLLTVSAIDPDYGSTSQIYYSVINGTWSTYFSVDKYSGSVSQVKSISWASCNGLVVFNVKASKNSTLFSGLSAIATVSVQVLGADASGPVFNMASYHAIVPVLASIGTAVSLQPYQTPISIVDSDIGIDAMFSLTLKSIDQSTTINQFSISPSFAQSNAFAAILVNSNLQDLPALFQFVILAVDTNTTLKRSASATVTVTIQPYVSFPLFAQSYYAFNIPQNTAAGSLIGTVTANKSFSGTGGGIGYALNYTYDNMFSVNSSTGALLLVNSSLLRLPTQHKQNTYALTLLAVIGNVTTATSVLVNVMNADSNPPQFVPSNTYSVNVSQSLTAGSVVLQVQAFDPDYMEQVVFSLSLATVSFSYPFAINATSGAITLTSLLNYATTSNYSLLVVATKPAISLSSTATVFVQVQYASFYAPVFAAAATVSNLTVNGVLPAGTALFTANATDPNVPAAQSNITYSLVSAPPSLVISASSGVVSTSVGFNYQTPTSFVLVVKAVSNAGSGLSSYLQLTVFVLSPPAFTQSAYFVLSFNSHSAVGSFVTQLQAVDNNVGGSPLFYSLNYSASSPSTYASAFAINQNNGSLMLQSSLQNATALITLVAFARNAFGLLTSTLVYVSLLPYNSYAPQFSYPPQTNFTVFFSSLASSSQVYSFMAQDNDPGSNGVVRYTLSSACTDNQYFSIDSISGTLTAAANLSAINTLFRVCVQAYDLGQPTSMSSNTSLTIVIYNANTSPVFAQRSISFYVPQGATGFVGTLPVASVAGSGSDICYYIIAGDPSMQFQLNAITGALFVAQNFSTSASSFAYLLGFASTYCSSVFDHPGVNGNSGALSVLQLGSTNPSIVTINLYVIATTTTTLAPTTTAYVAPHFSSAALIAGITTFMNPGTVIINAASYVNAGSASSFMMVLDQCNNSTSLGNLSNPFNLTSQGLVIMNFLPAATTSGMIVCQLQVNDANVQTSSPSLATLNVYVLNNTQMFIATVSINQTWAVLSALPLSSFLSSSLSYDVVAAQVLQNPQVLSYSDIYLFAVNKSTMQIVNTDSAVGQLAQLHQQLSSMYTLYSVATIAAMSSFTSAPTTISSTIAPAFVTFNGSTVTESTANASTFPPANVTSLTVVINAGIPPVAAIVVGVILGVSTLIAAGVALHKHMKYEKLKRYDVNPKRRSAAKPNLPSENGHATGNDRTANENEPAEVVPPIHAIDIVSPTTSEMVDMRVPPSRVLNSR